MENLSNSSLNIKTNKEEENDTCNDQEDNKNQNISMFNEIIDDLIRKKTSKENELKSQIEKNKKNLLEKFYSMTNTSLPKMTHENQTNQSVEKDILFNNGNSKDNNNTNLNPINSNFNDNQIISSNNITNLESSSNQKISTNIIPNNNKTSTDLDQKEYDEIKEKYKNERNKKKSSIFKSEDLRISNTSSVHLKKEDFSPINPGIVNIENKNNILIIQKKLFGENEETSKVENIDEIDDLDFEDINIKDFKEEENKVSNNTNVISNNNQNGTFDTNNINFDLSSNLKSEINENIFPNEILVKERALEYCYINQSNDKIINRNKENKNHGNRNKNFSVQLVSKLDYYIDESKNLVNHRDRKCGSNQVMNEMTNFIQNLIPHNSSSLNNNVIDSNGGNNNIINRKINEKRVNNINNNININNINNNININNNLEHIIDQQNNAINNNFSNGNNYTRIRNNTRIMNGNYINNNNQIINAPKNGNNNKNLNNNKQKIKLLNEQNYKKLNVNQKPYLKNITGSNSTFDDKINFRYIVNSNNPSLINSKTKNLIRHSTSNINKKNNSINKNIAQKCNRKNNSVIIKREFSSEKSGTENSTLNNYKHNYNSNTTNPKTKLTRGKKSSLYHFYTNNNYENYQNGNDEFNAMKNNIKNIMNQIPFACKNPLSTKNKKILINKADKKKLNSSYHGNTNSSSICSPINNGNKLAVINTINKNSLLKFSKLNYQIEVINKLKQYSYSGLYFIYVDKINDGFLFKGIYRRGPSEMNHICNKIYGIPNTPLMLSYEKFFILVENNKKEFIMAKPSVLNTFNFTKSILLIKNE